MKLILSDIHAHNWSVFQKVAPTGVNGRLQIIINEIDRACDMLLQHGGNKAFIAGDIFHVRGSVDPEVLNPLQRCFRRNMEKGIDFDAIPGNHDLKSKETTELGSAIQTLSETFSASGYFRVHNEPTVVQHRQCAFIPWFTSIESLLFHAKKLAQQIGADLSQFDLIIHAGIDGVIARNPDHGLTSKMLLDLGYRRVFAGHYHNYKAMEDDKVFSIGAMTHQTWGDVGSKAGFILADDKEVRHYSTHAPQFVDVSGKSEQDMSLLADGNYVRFRGPQMTTEEVKELREFLESSGALGVSIEAPKAAVAPRAARPASSSMTLDQSVGSYIDSMTTTVDKNEVRKQSQDILDKARAVFEEA